MRFRAGAVFPIDKARGLTMHNLSFGLTGYVHPTVPASLTCRTDCSSALKETKVVGIATRK